MGRIPDFHHFDGAFFGLLQQMNEVVEPSGRLLLETAYEAIVDAGKLSTEKIIDVQGIIAKISPLRKRFREIPFSCQWSRELVKLRQKNRGFWIVS